MTGDHLLLAATVLAGLVAGLALRLPSCLTECLAPHIGVAEGRTRLLWILFQFLLVPMMVGSGWLIDKWGSQAVLVGGALLTAIAIASIEFTRRYRQVLPVILVLAAAAAAVATASIAIMPLAFLPHRVVASTNLGFVALTLGFLLAPELTRRLQTRYGFRRSLQILALVCLLPALPAVMARAAAFENPAPPAGTASALADPRLWLAALLVVLYQPLEASLTTLTPAYLKELGHPKATAPVLWWSFWGAFLAARIVAAFFVHAGFAPWFIPVLVLLAAITLGHLVGAYSPASGSSALVLLGVCLGPLLPSIVGLVLQIFPAERGIAVGITMAGAALGGLLLAPLIDAYARRASARVAMRLPLGVALAMMGAGLGLALVVAL